MDTKIELRNPFDLVLNRFQKQLPDPDKASPQWQSFVESVRAGGVREPVDITKAGQVIHGKSRFLAARAANLDEIPCIVRDEAEAALILVESLIHRRHMTRGAALYLVLPLLKDFIESAENRRLANLRRGTKTIEKPLKSPKGSTLPIGEDLSDLCQRFGVSIRVFNQAVMVMNLFAKKPELKKDLEPQLLNGEKNLWNVLSAAGGEETDQGGRELGVAAGAFNGFRKAGAVWKKLSRAEREEVENKWREQAAALPQDLRNALTEVLTEEVTA